MLSRISNKQAVEKEGPALYFLVGLSPKLYLLGSLILAYLLVHDTHNRDWEPVWLHGSMPELMARGEHEAIPCSNTAARILVVWLHFVNVGCL